MKDTDGNLASSMNIDTVVSEEDKTEKHTYWRSWSPDDKNNSLTKVFEFIDPESSVLDVGCSTGDLGKALQEQKNCTVTGVDYDKNAVSRAKKVLSEAVCADIEKEPLDKLFSGKKFDFIIFADVLEHLNDALAVINSASKLLAADGSIIISVPNVAHSSVRLALFEGRFNYTEEGLLDKTHLRFFTKESLDQLLYDAGLLPVAVEKTFLGALDTEIPIEAGGVITDDLIKTAEMQDEGTTYQFVVRAVPEPDEKRRELLNTRHKYLERTIKQREDEIEIQKFQEQNIKDDIAEFKEDIEHTLVYLARTLPVDARKQFHDIKCMLNDTRHKLDRMNEDVIGVRNRVDRWVNILPFRIIRNIRRKIKGITN